MQSWGEVIGDYGPFSELTPAPVPEEQVPNPISGPQDVPEEPLFGTVNRIHQGTIKLHVEAPDSLQQVAQFVDELRQNSDIRLLQLVGNYKQGVGIGLVLRTPMRLEECLLRMGGVSAVETNGQCQDNGFESLLNVRLEEVAPVQ